MFVIHQINLIFLSTKNNIEKTSDQFDSNLNNY